MLQHSWGPLRWAPAGRVVQSSLGSLIQDQGRSSRRHLVGAIDPFALPTSAFPAETQIESVYCAHRSMARACLLVLAAWASASLSLVPVAFGAETSCTTGGNTECCFEIGTCGDADGCESIALPFADNIAAFSVRSGCMIQMEFISTCIPTYASRCYQSRCFFYLGGVPYPPPIAQGTCVHRRPIVQAVLQRLTL